MADDVLSCLPDEGAKSFWKSLSSYAEYCDHSFRWTAFIFHLYAHLKRPFPEQRDALVFRAEKGRVTIHSFADVIRWFGPPKDKLFLKQIEAVVSRGYFYGHLGTAGAEAILSSHSPGTFIVRFWPQEPGFVVSVKRSDEQVEHHRVLRSGNEKGAVEFMFVGAEKASIPCAESLDALLKAARTALGLRKYAPGSPYKQILTARPVPSLRDLCTSYIALHPEEAVHKAVFQSPFLTSFIPSTTDLVLTSPRSSQQMIPPNVQELCLSLVKARSWNAWVKLLRLFMRPLSSSLLPDPSAYRFWTEHFGLKEEVMLKSFLAKLTKHIGALPIHMPALRGVLVDIGKGHGKPDMVTMETFGKLLHWFGSLSDGQEFVHRVFDVISRPYFHGLITATEAEQALQGQRKGTFLLRFSTTQPGVFCLACINKDNICHYNVKREANGRYSLQGKECDTVHEIIMRFASALYLLNACPGASLLRLSGEDTPGVNHATTAIFLQTYAERTRHDIALRKATV